MYVGWLVSRFNTYSAIFTLFAFLSSCGGGGGSENSAELTRTTEAVISGSVGDGPITGATLKIFDRNGNLIQTEFSDTNAAYSAHIDATSDSYPLTIEVSGGIDLVTQREPDFKLASVIVRPDVKVANINPFTTLIVEAARSMPGGLNEENIADIQDTVHQQLNFGLDPVIVADPITTTITDDNIAVMVKASEALGETIRRTVNSLQFEGLSVSADQVVEAISHDLVDGLLDGLGGKNADNRIAAVTTVASAQVLVEALSNNLKVDGVVATSALDAAIRVTNPSTPDSALTDGVRINREMLLQARTTIEAARALATDSALSTIADALPIIQNNSLAADIEASLPGDTSSDLDTVISLAASIPEPDLIVVNNVVRMTAEEPSGEPLNNAPIMSGTPGSSIAEDSAYVFQPSASDPDNDSLSFNIQNRPIWASFDKNTGRLSGTPGNAHVGDHRDIVITVSDGSAEDSIGPFSILVSNTNDAPTISGNTPTSVTAGTTYVFQPNATDADGDNLIFSISNRPSWASFDKNTGRLSGTPNNTHVGDYKDIVITVSDGAAIASLTAFDLTVTHLNSAPTPPNAGDACDPTGTPAWQEYATAFKNGVPTTLPDFSYAGYARSEKEPPTVSGPIFDVKDYGAFADDNMDDRDAIMEAIAAAQKNKGGVVLFGSGRYLISEVPDKNTPPITITSSNIVLRGAGSEPGGTELFMRYNLLQKNSSMASTPFMVEAVGEASTLGSWVTKIVGDATRGSFEIMVENGTGLKAGDTIILRLLDKHAGPPAILPYVEGDQNNWVTLLEEGDLTRELHVIAEVNGTKVRLAEPLLTDVQAKYSWGVHAMKNMGTDFGVEDLALVGDWKGTFEHHKNALHDGGWSALKIRGYKNSWVRGVRVTDVNRAIQVINSLGVTVQDVVLDGNPGHTAITALRSYGVLMTRVQDRTESAMRKGHWHGPGTQQWSAGTVIHRSEWPVDSGIQLHGGLPYATLYDAIRGGFSDPDQWGGATTSLPNHMRHLVIWNFDEIGNSRSMYNFWDTSITWGGRVVLPLIVGFHGVGTTFRAEQLELLESHGTSVQPESLFEAQLQCRLGELPMWLKR